MESKAYDVYLQNEFKRIGFKWGPQTGGLVYDGNDNVVGQIRKGIVHNEFVLWAQSPHHTGHKWDGEVLIFDNRPRVILK